MCGEGGGRGCGVCQAMTRLDSTLQAIAPKAVFVLGEGGVCSFDSSFAAGCCTKRCVSCVFGRGEGKGGDGGCVCARVCGHTHTQT